MLAIKAIQGILHRLARRLGRRSGHSLLDQLEAFEKVGLAFHPSVTIEDIEYSFTSEEFEEEPYKLLFFVLGSEVEREPWGRRISDRVWNFDVECIEGPGSYATILQNLAGLAGHPQLIQDIDDPVGSAPESDELSYSIDGTIRRMKVRVREDWADEDVVDTMMRDIEAAVGTRGRSWSADNGQASVLTFLTPADASAINALCPGLLRPCRAALGLGVAVIGSASLPTP